MTDYPETDVFRSRDFLKCWEISDNILETVEDGDVVAKED